MNIINKETLKYFPKGAIITNSARGDMIDDKAMLEALKNERIYALGIMYKILKSKKTTTLKSFKVNVPECGLLKIWGYQFGGGIINTEYIVCQINRVSCIIFIRNRLRVGLMQAQMPSRIFSRKSQRRHFSIIYYRCQI